MRGVGRARVLLTACVLAGLAAASPSSAGAKERIPPAPPRGWVVDRARFENLSAGDFLEAPGTGEVRGLLDVVADGGGVAVVNELTLDDYLKGVAEVPSAWPVEALRAQAIAARTFALYEMGRDLGSGAKAAGAHICSTQACQMYVGVAKERQDHGERWVQAVESTRGQVVLYKGEPILAMYSSSNGGRSVPGGRPYLNSVNDPDSASGPYGHWAVHLGYGELTSVFGLPGPLASLRRDGDEVVLDWSVPGGASGRMAVPVPAFRDRLNERVAPRDGMPQVVPSTQFSILADDQTGTATLDGRGHGHGIGLSQFGALGKASRGLRAGDILASYYGGLRPVTAPPDQLPPTIRVAVGTGRGAVAVGDTGRFRVIDGSGAPLAVAASGTWRIVPAGKGRLRVVPPPDQEAPPTVDNVEATGPAATGPASGPAGEARFRLGEAALVRVRVEGEALAGPVETEPVLVEPGDAALPLPALAGPGRYTVSVLADAGAGRVTTATGPLRVTSPAAAGARSVDARRAGAVARGMPRPAALASGLLLAVLVLLAGLSRDRCVPSSPTRLLRRRHG